MSSSPKSTRPYRVAMAGYYGFGNLGDELLLRASLCALERVGISRRDILVFSGDPVATEQRFGVTAALRWSFRDVVKGLMRSQTLLLGGGGLFQDSSSLSSCVWYWGLVRLARFCGVVPWAIGQSIGPLRSWLAQKLSRDALAACAALHVRDVTSWDWAHSRGIAAVSGHDLVLSLPWKEFDLTRKRTFLINLRPSENLEDCLLCARYCVAAFGGDVVGVALASEDAVVLEQVRKELSFRDIVLVQDLTTAEKVWSSASQALGMRLHFGVLSTLAGTPLALMPYDPKVRSFAQQVGVPCYAEVPDGEFVVPQMPDAPDRIQASVDAVCRSVLNV